MAPSNRLPFDVLLRILRAEVRASELEQAQVGHIDALKAARQDAAEEVRKLQQGKRYRLGTLLVEALHSPSAFARLPWKILEMSRAPRRQDARTTLETAESRAPASPVDSMPPDEGSDRSVARAALPLPADLARLRVAVVLDEFSEASFAPECELMPLSPRGWAEEIEAFQPHMLLVESAWRGRNGEWTGLVDGNSATLRSLVGACRKSGIPTAFWNKEDPLHFEAFIEAARSFDAVFTTDVDSIPVYRRELGHERVYLLPFAMQPRMYHPIGDGDRENAAFFAGAWYDRMAERSSSLRRLLDAWSLICRVDIYDRNFGRPGAEGRFPAKYGHMLRGGVPYEELPEIFRRYRFGLNLNTIKDSPSMFARRVFELLGCGVSVYGNYSRGQCMMFGDLAVASDDIERVFRIAWQENSNPDSMGNRVRRLSALRKVLEQHTYRHRLQEIVYRTLGIESRPATLRVVAIARAIDHASLSRILQAYRRQRFASAALFVQVPEALRSGLPADIQALDDATSAISPADAFGGAWIAPLHQDDFYGEDYLHDLVLARNFTSANVLGKAAFLRRSNGRLASVGDEGEYRPVSKIALRRALFAAGEWPGTIASLLDGMQDGALQAHPAISLDVLSYVEDGVDNGLPEIESIQLDRGIAFEDMCDLAARLPAAPALDGSDSMFLNGSALTDFFVGARFPVGASLARRRHRMELCSRLGAGVEETLSSEILPPGLLERDGRLTVSLEAALDPDWSCALQVVSRNGDVTATIPLPPRVTVDVERPAAAGYRLCLSIRGSIVRHLDGLWLKRRPATPMFLPGNGRLLLVTNIYPEGKNFYRNAFVHRRVLEYRQRGIAIDVVRVAAGEAERSYEFDGVVVMVCSPEALRATLAISGHSAIAVHFLDRTLWHGIGDAVDATPTVVWVHGAEIQPWTRRSFNFGTETERETAREASDDRLDFWRMIVGRMPGQMRLAFVSRTFAEECWADLGQRLTEDKWAVIHNPIDTRLFSASPKPAEDRWNILSIRSHATRVYANDLVADVIRRLAPHPLFPKMRFTLVGDGELFERNFAGLDAYPNVRVSRRHMSQDEMMGLFGQNGIFLVPTRSDTQGVSRDEAMAAGLVPVTNAVASVPEFVDEESGILSPPEDAAHMAASILALVEDPDRFLAMSAAAAKRVRAQSDITRIVDQELAWLFPDRRPERALLPDDSAVLADVGGNPKLGEGMGS